MGWSRVNLLKPVIVFILIFSIHLLKLIFFIWLNSLVPSVHSLCLQYHLILSFTIFEKLSSKTELIFEINILLSYWAILN